MADKKNSVNYSENQSRTLINKSHPSIHFTLDPKVSMTGAAAKGLNTLIFAMQRQARQLSDSVSDYHSKLGKGNTFIHMQMSEFSKLIGVSSRNYDALKRAILEMGGLKVTWSNNGIGENANYGFHNLFVRAEVKDSTIEFVIPPESRELFINDKNVAVIDFIKVAENLSSKYSIFLHDIIEENMSKIADHAVTNVLKFTNDELRNALKVPYDLIDGTKKYSYPTPSKFIDKVLKPAISEYNAAEMKYRILSFDHEKGKNWSLEIIPVSKSYIRQVEMERPDDLHGLIVSLKQFGLNEINRNEFINAVETEKDFEYLLYCRDITLKNSRMKNGSAGGFFRTVYKNNKETFDTIWQTAIKEREIANAAKRKKEQELIELQRQEHRATYIKNRVDVLIEKIYKSEELLDEFLESIVRYVLEIKHPLARRYKSEIESGVVPGKDDPMVRHLAHKKLEISEEEIAEYVSNQPIKISV